MDTRVVKKKKGKGGLIVTTLSFIIICVAIALSISVFFRVSRIEVVGTEFYSPEEIIQASDIEKGDSLLRLNCGNVAAKISGKLLYAGNVVVSKKMPDTVLVEIFESGAAAYVDTDEGSWLVDNYCRFLEPVKAGDRDKYVKVIGVSAVSPKAGQEISVVVEDKHKGTYLKELLFELSNADMLISVETIDVSNTANVEFSFLDRFSVKLGNNEDLDAKLKMLKNSIAEIGDTEEGIFDLSERKKASFKPLEE